MPCFVCKDCFKDIIRREEEVTWLNWTERYFNPLEDDANYLVCCKMSDGSFTIPHKAYYIEEEDRMFSLENNNSHPVCCDIYMELPKVTNET